MAPQAAAAALCALGMAPPTVSSLPRRPLTAVILVTVVRAVIVLVASPYRGDAAFIPAPKLVFVTFLDWPCAGERGREPNPRPHGGLYWVKERRRG